MQKQGGDGDDLDWFNSVKQVQVLRITDRLFPYLHLYLGKVNVL